MEVSAPLPSTLDQLRLYVADLLKQLADESADPLPLLSRFSRLISDPGLPEPLLTQFADSSQSAETKESLFVSGLKFIMQTTFDPKFPVVSEAVNQVLVQSLDLVVSRLSSHSERIIEALFVLFYKGTKFYSQHGYERPFPDLGLSEEEIADLKAWRKTVGVRAWVDVLHHDTWRAAQVIEVADEFVKVNYERLRSSYDEYVHRQRLFPCRFLSKEIDFDKWRRELSIGSQCDLLDSALKWYTATVLDHNAIEDKLFFTYNGWHHKFDEWVPRYSKRLAPYRSIAKGGKEEGGVPHDPNEKNLDDLADPDDVAALFRGREWGSFYLVDLVIRFHQKGGFSEILRRLNIHDPNLPASTLRYYVEAIANISAILSKPFAATFVSRFANAVFETVLAFSDVEMRYLSKEIMDSLLENLERIMRRGMQRNDVGTAMEKFSLDSALRRFQSQVIERKINGLSFIASKATRIRRAYSNVNMDFGDKGYWISSPKVLTQWIQENHIIEDIFHSKDPHIELIKRSGEILKFLCSEKALTTGFLNDLWNSILKYLMLDSLSTEEQKTSDAMLKVLEEIAPLLDDDQSSLLLQLISKVPAHRLNSSLIDICREFSRTSALRSSDLAVKVVDVLWFMIQETPASDVSKKPSRAFLDVMEFARAKLDETLKTGFFHEKKVELLQECFQNYKESTSVLQALTTIPKIFESYPTRAYMHEELSRSDVSNWMQTEGRIEEIFFKDIVDFQSKCLKTLSSLKAAEVNGAYITSRSTYLDHVRTRLEFLKFLLVQEIVTLSRTHLDSLWKAFHDESLSVQAKEMFFRWLVDLLKSKKADPTYYVGQNVNFYSMDPISSRSKKLLSDEVLSHVFESKLSSPSMCQVTLAGFRCIEAFFLEVNVQRGAVEMAIESEQSTTPSFKVLFFSKLVGLELLWNVFLMSRSEENDVIEYSRNLIHHIYNRTHFQDEQTSLQIRKDFLEKCMKHVETCVPIKDYSGINRILKLLNMTLDVFERNSLFSSSPQFRPHGRQFKGKKLEITVSNNIPSSSAPRSLVVEIFDRESIGDFRLKISKRLGALPQCLRIFCAGHELKPDLHDHKSFIDLVTMFNTPEIPKNVIVTRTETQFRVQLLDPLTKQLTSEAKEVFSEIFYRFADPETKIMNIERLAKYIKSCGVSAFNYSEDRLKMLFRQFGVSKGDFLPPTYGAQDSSETPVSSDWYFDVNHFLDFYREACDSRLLNVYKDLQAHGFLEDLRSEKDALKEMETRVENPHSDPRMILCGFSRFLASEELDDKTSDNGEQYFELLFDVLHLEETDECSAASLVAESVWEILMRIPTNPKLKDSLLSLETTQGKALNWDQLFDSHSLRKLLYSLQVIEPMLSPQDATSEIKLSDALGEDSLTEDWRKKFTLSGGFAHLYKVFSKFSIKTGILSRVSRECLALLLTSVSIFVSGALSVSRPTFEEVARLVSMASQDLDIFLGEFVSAKPVKANDADDFSLSPDAPPIYGPDLPAGYIEGPTSPSIDAAIPPVGEQQEIMKLSRQMSSGLGDRILRHVNISELQETLWRLLNEASMQSVDTFERFDQVTVTMCTQLILCFFHFEPIKTFDHFKSLFAENHVALVRPMLSLNRFLRKQIGIVIYSISCLLFTDLSPNSFISSVLLQSMPSGVYSEDKNYEMFFAVLTLATRYQLSREKHGKDVQKIIDTLYERISVQALSHKSSEVLGSTKPDRILIGLLGLLAVLIESKHVQSEEDTASLIQILHQIIEEFLFSKEISSSKPKCKTVMSQNLAFNVVFQIIQKLKKKQLLSDLFSKLGSIIAQATKSDRWNYNPGNRIRSSLGFVGLKNQGCTCYMNSLLQQFFMMEDFRRGIMDAQAPMEAERSRQDNLLFQLQMMFGFLRTSQRQDYDTAPFCFSYKDESGKNPIDVRVQQDAQEFFNVFTDRIERLLKSTPYDRLLRNSFGGRLVNQMICQGGCGKIRETEEDFYTVSLQIAGKPTMKDSLDAYVSSETLNGVFCEHCNKKADTFRRVVLNDLPNTLIFHLKRFQLDFETFTNQKLNDRFEFPLEIDLHPYSKEGMAERDRVSKSESIDACDVDGKMEAQEVSVDIDSVLIEKIELPSLKPPEYFKYSLCGIVIHMGTAQAGHYFSYIKDKKSGGWVEFNDSVIKPFDINTLAENAFGGKSQSDAVDTEFMSWESEVYKMGENFQNAYMLVYQRNSPIPSLADVEASKHLDSKAETPNTGNASEVSLDSLTEMVRNARLSDISPSEERIPQFILDTVRQDNEALIRDGQVYSEAFSSFMLNMVKSLDKIEFYQYENVPAENESLDFLSLFSSFVLEIGARSGNKDIARESVFFLRTCIEKNIPLCKMVLSRLGESLSLLCELILGISEFDLRHAFCELVTSGILTLLPLEMDFLGETVEIEVPEKSSMGDVKSFRIEKRFKAHSEALLNGLLILIEQTPKHWTRFNEYFGILFKLSQSNRVIRTFFVEQDVVAMLGDLFLGEQSPFSKSLGASIGSKVLTPPFNNLLKTIAILILQCPTQHAKGEFIPPSTLVDKEDDLSTLPRLPEKSKQIIFTRPFFAKSLSSMVGVEEITQIICHWSWEWEGFSDSVIQIILDGIHRASDQNVKPFFDVMRQFVCIEDSLQQFRIDKLFQPNKGILHILNIFKNGHKAFTYESIKNLLQVVESSPTCAKAMAEQRPQWVWMDSWLKEFISSGHSSGPPALARQESRHRTFEKLSSQVLQFGGELVLDDTVIQGASSEFEEPGEVGPGGHYMLEAPPPSAGRNAEYVGPSSAAEEVPTRDSREWSCPACTFLNSASSLWCDICEQRKP